jgi:STE24 endopeptidase
MLQINALLVFFLILYGIRALFQIGLSCLNMSHLRHRARVVPELFRGILDQDGMDRVTAYTVDSTRFGLVTELVNQCVVLGVLLSVCLPWLAHVVSSWVSHPVGQGMVFFALLAMILNLPQIPFSLYQTFVLEERHGFNTRTFRIWLVDLIKQTVVSAAFGCIILGTLLILLDRLPQTWWIWAWVVLAIFEGLVLWLYPVVIAPWFNRFDPITDAALNRRIRYLMREAGLDVGGIYQMDAAKRTRHTNAYFTGLGRTKRIVIFDSLLDAHSDDEIVAILSHEIGHWKRQHIIKLLLVVWGTSFVALYAAARLIEWPLLYQTFGFDKAVAFVGLFVTGILMSLVGFFSRPLAAGISRSFEQEADDLALDLTGTSVPLTQALRKLAVHNLINLNPHPLYAWFYNSHPPIVNRIERLERMGRSGSRDETEPEAI